MMGTCAIWGFGTGFIKAYSNIGFLLNPFVTQNKTNQLAWGKTRTPEAGKS